MAVSITMLSSKGVHGGALTISGSGFGTKSPAAPVISDNCSGTNVMDLWTGKYPNASGDPYNTVYRDAPYRGINAPHTRVGRFMTGCHYPYTGPNLGWNVMVWKARTVSSYPQYTYASWYQRADDAWTFGGDNNYKCYDYNGSSTPYNLPNNWYTEFNARPTSKTSGCAWKVNDDNGSWDISNDFSWGQPGTNPMSGVWTKVEHFIKISNAARGGLIKIVDNGVTKLNVPVRTDNMSGTSRADAIGGYSGRGAASTTNFRYFADLYLDYTWQHVCLGNASTIQACTRLEVQRPTAWSDTSITVTVNRGAFTDTDTVYVYVYDANGVPNSNGFQMGSDITAPPPPKNLRVT